MFLGLSCLIPFVSCAREFAGFIGTGAPFLPQRNVSLHRMPSRVRFDPLFSDDRPISLMPYAMSQLPSSAKEMHGSRPAIAIKMRQFDKDPRYCAALTSDTRCDAARVGA